MNMDEEQKAYEVMLDSLLEDMERGPSALCCDPEVLVCHPKAKKLRQLIRTYVALGDALDEPEYAEELKETNPYRELYGPRE